jgi:hypothetical protein
MISRKTRALVIPTVIVLLAGLGYTQTSISAAEAKNHVGERATVCGEVASTRYAARTRGNPTSGGHCPKSAPSGSWTHFRAIHIIIS